MILTAEETKTLKSQVATTLLEAGFAAATIYKKNNTAGRRWSEAYGGFTYALIEGTIWHDGSITPSKLRIRRWAEGQAFGSNPRQLSPEAYKASLEAAGFITEVKGKDLYVLGKERVEA
jgi:hypothetical protein